MALNVEHKEENEGKNSRGRLSAEEFNNLIDTIKELEKDANTPASIGGLKNVSNDADQTSATDDVLVRRAGHKEWIPMPYNSGSSCNFQFEIKTQEQYDTLKNKDRSIFYFIADETEKKIPKIYLGDLLFAAGIGGGGGDDDILIETILLDKYQLTLDDSPERITSTFLPDNATSRTLVWSSSDVNVATVASSGIVTPTGNGSCIVTVRAVRGTASAEAIVTVSISVRSVEIENSEATLKQDEPLQLITKVLPENAADKSLKYSSSNPDVATVNNSGLVTHVKDGNVIITVKSANDKSDTIALRALTPVRGISITNKISSLDVGETYQFHSEFTPSSPTNKNFVWATSDVNIVSMDNGLVTALKKGNVLITVTSEDGNKTDENAVRVILPVTGLQISGSNKAVFGYDIQLGFIPIPSDADVDTLKWSVSDKSLAEINNDGLLTPKAANGTFTVTISDEKHNVTATLQITLFALAIRSIVCDEGDTVNNIFTNWNVDVVGNATRLAYKEYAGDSLLQSGEVDLPIEGKLPIELYPEFGEKRIEFTASNADGETDLLTKEILYQEPELVTYDFDIDVQCTQEQAQGMSMEVPYYKYDKKFVYNLRNDDNLTSLWRMAFRYCNREIMPKVIKRYERTDDAISALLPAERRRSPRRLGYTNGCGVLIPFVFDVAGTVQSENGLTFDSGGSTIVQRSDIMKMRDYGAHFLLHNMAFLDSDPVKPKYDNDYSYPLQRDREILYREFGYTSVTFANPDGDPYYTQPCIKDPKTLLMSGGGYAFRRPEDLADGIDGSTYGERFPEAVQYYGLPSHRTFFTWSSDLANVPLSEIRNTLHTLYVYAENHPYTVNLWKTQYQKALVGQPTLATELTHGLGYDLESNGSANESASAKLKLDLEFFEEVFDVVGANGKDMIWFCPADESIEYMYYQRVAKITKTITATGCHFNVNIQIPDYLSYKTYSVIIRNLPEDAVVTRGQGVTMFHKNMKTGLINFGYSTDIPERAARYVQQYLNNKTADNLDKAWYFVRQLGELQTSYAAQLPVFNECPVLSAASCPSSVTKARVMITTTNSNKEFGEANYLDVSDNPEFSDSRSYAIPSGQHKWYDSLDAECLKNQFDINLEPLFGVQQNLYVRLRNVYGVSESKVISVIMNRQEGVNDPRLSVTANATYFVSDVELTIDYDNVSEIRYKQNDGNYTNWQTISDKLPISLSSGDNVIVIEARNNLNEIASQTIESVFVEVEWEVKATAAFMDTFSRGESWASPTNNPQYFPYIAETGFTKLPNGSQKYYNNTPLYDVNQVNRGIVANIDTFIDDTYGFLVWRNQGNSNGYVSSPVTGDNSAIYPDDMIDIITTAGNVQSGWKVKDNFSGRSAFMFRNLSPGKYIVNLFGRHLVKEQTGTGIAFVRDNTDPVLTSYIVSKEFNGQLLYDNKNKVVSLEFTVTDSTQEFQIGMDARYDLYGNDATDRQYGFNVIHLIKIKD